MTRTMTVEAMAEAATEAGGALLRRALLVLAATLIVAAMMAVSAMPAMAKNSRDQPPGPPTNSGGKNTTVFHEPGEGSCVTHSKRSDTGQCS